LEIRQDSCKCPCKGVEHAPPSFRCVLGVFSVLTGPSVGAFLVHFHLCEILTLHSSRERALVWCFEQTYASFTTLLLHLPLPNLHKGTVFIHCQRTSKYGSLMFPNSNRTQCL
jgi:hypothetical protein